jgi:uncharacterized protein (TIGR02246 family)
MKICKILCVIWIVVLCCLAVSSCSKPKENDVAQIQALEKSLADAFMARDLNGFMAAYMPDDSLIVFDATPPRQYIGANAYRKDWEGFLATFPGPIRGEMIDYRIETEGNLGYGHGFIRMVVIDKDGKQLDSTFRATKVYRKINGKWLIVHEHDSWPVDMASGKADFTSKQ